MQELVDFLEFLYEPQTGFIYCPLKYRQDTTQYIMGKAWDYKFFHWPQEKRQLIDWILTASREGDLYISPAIYKAKRAIKNNVKGSQVVWIEFDGKDKINFRDIPKPHGVVRTSFESHVHCYWRVPFSAGPSVEILNRKLTYYLEADSSGWDINQVLRPPGTHNQKRDLPVVLEKLEKDGLIQLSAFDSIPDPKTEFRPVEIGDLPDPLDVLQKHVFPKKWWERFRSADPEIGKRSDFVQWASYSLAEFGLQHDEIVSLLLVLDKRIGKFDGRRDQLVRLSESASLAVGKIGNTSSETRFPTYSFKEIQEYRQESLSFLWDGLLPSGGSGILFGPPGVGKTQLSLELSQRMSLGRSFLGKGLKNGKVLFVSMEMGVLGIKYVLDHQLKAYRPADLQVFDELIDIRPIGYRIDTDDITRMVHETEPAIVIVDSMFAASRKELDEEETTRLMNWDNSIRTNYGTAVWWIHHPRKSTDGNKRPRKLDDLYGGRVLGVQTDLVLFLNETNGLLNIQSVKNRFGPQFIENFKKRSDWLTIEHVSDKGKSDTSKIDKPAGPRMSHRTSGT